jgi:DNA helicase-2/ATP-dependent DNA helicase PcrA
MDLLDELVRINKPLLVLAGPGMGKTEALAYKIKYLVKDLKVDKNEITVITFTNEAAINMRKRISQEGRTYVEPESQPEAICTMHKLCNDVIKNHLTEAELSKGFKVLSSQYIKKILMSDCAQIVGGKRKDSKETILCRQRSECEKTESLKCTICSAYEDLLRRFNHIDHDDQLLLACNLLKKNDGILRKVQRKARYLLVDEYQDINFAQWEMIKLLSSGNTKNLFVVGDDYQSIYGFRGGDPKFIRNFKDDYKPDAEVRYLRTSYRCPPNIFKGAFYMVYKYNKGDMERVKNLEFKNKRDTYINLWNFDHNNIEAAFIAGTIKELGPSYDVLILVPDADYFPSLRNALRKRYVNFLCEYDIEKAELYIIYVLLEWLKNPNDNFYFRILLEEIINRGVSDIPGLQTDRVGKEENRKKRENAFNQISNQWREVGKGKTLYTQLKILGREELFIKLAGIISTLRETYGKKDDIITFVAEVIDKLRIWRNIDNFSEELNSAVEEIQNIAVLHGECNVRILTMKKAKGLQADYVFIVGLENNILPRINAGKPDKEEDSRLLYVSMTRAKKELFLLHSEARDQDITKVRISGRSEFLDAIPDKYVKIGDFTKRGHNKFARHK